MISAALFTALSASLLALASPLAMRAGAPSSPQSITVSDLTECGVANISFSGPGVEPYTLEIGTGGFYVGIEEIVTYTNITANETSVFWIVNQPVDTSMFFQLTDSSSPYPQVTYVQNRPVTAPINSTSNSSETLVNGTLTCSLGEGRVYPSTETNGTWVLAANQTTSASNETVSA